MAAENSPAGTLGGSVARSLHDSDNFQPRVLSRDPTTEKAKVLLDLGIEVVKADNWDAGAMQKAFQGCWGVFINIDSDLPVSKESPKRNRRSLRPWLGCEADTSQTEFQTEDWPRGASHGKEHH